MCQFLKETTTKYEKLEGGRNDKLELKSLKKEKDVTNVMGACRIWMPKNLRNQLLYYIDFMSKFGKKIADKQRKDHKILKEINQQNEQQAKRIDEQTNILSCR